MAVSLRAFASMATLYLISVLVMLHRGSLRLGAYRGRRHVVPTSTQGEEIPFARKEGQTIVAVGDTTTAMRFYSGSDVMDEKNEGSMG